MELAPEPAHVKRPPPAAWLCFQSLRETRLTMRAWLLLYRLGWFTPATITCGDPLLMGAMGGGGVRTRGEIARLRKRLMQETGA